MKLRYMIIGAGGVGGPVGAYLSKSGADTTLIARGKHLAVLQEHGLTLVSGENERESIPVKAIDMDGFLAAREQGAPSPDVIFVCVKGYSLADTVPFIRKAAGRDTVVIPVLNIYGTGRALHPDNVAAGPASYGLTDSMGRMHGDAQFAGSSSVPAHVEMMGLIGAGNNPMVGMTVACAVAASQANA